jgi:hypothetical protein
MIKRLLGYNLSLNTKNEGLQEEKCRKSKWQHVFRISLVAFIIRLIVLVACEMRKCIELKKKRFQATFTEFSTKLYGFREMYIR